jgi:hypothetical protein
MSIQKNMKHFYIYSALLIFFFLSQDCYSQYVIDWEDPIEVSEDGMDNNRPRITLDAAGNPLIIWGKDSGREIYFTRNDGSDFSDPITLLDPEFDVFTGDWAGPEMSSNGDDAFVTFKRYPENEFGAYILKSEDGGQTWSDTIRVDNIPIGDEQSRFPNVTVNDEGNPAVTLMKFTGNYLDPEYEVLTSSDGGLTFGPIVNSSTDLIPGEACDCCTADIVNSNGKLIQLYRNNASNIREIKVTISEDWGATFGEPVHIDDTDTFSNICFSSGPDGLVAGNKLIAVYRANIPNGYRVYASQYDLETGDILHFVVDPFVPSNVAQHNAKIAGDSMNQLMVWEEFTSVTSNVLYSYSTEGPGGFSAWSDTLNVVTSGRQVNPDVAYSDGEFHVVWQDKYSGRVAYRKGTVVEGVSVESLSDTQVIAFPNPFTTEFILKNLQGYRQIEVANILGQTIFQKEISTTQITIPMQDHPVGTYLVNLISNEGISSSVKLVKSK